MTLKSMFKGMNIPQVVKRSKNLNYFKLRKKCLNKWGRGWSHMLRSNSYKTKCSNMPRNHSHEIKFKKKKSE